jgi:site-specific DNA recombinase
LNGDHGDGDMSTTSEAVRRYRRHAAKRDLTDLAGLRAGLYVRVSKDPDPNKTRRKKEEAEKYTAKQTQDQKGDGVKWAAQARAVVADSYNDSDISASRFSYKDRPEFNRLVADVKSGKLDIIWFWELTRQQRKLGVFVELRDLCRDRGVLWVIRDRVYDLNNHADLLMLGFLSVMGEGDSEIYSERTLRGKRSSAEMGRPAGRVPYGYQRIYDPRTKAWLRDEADLFNGDGAAVENSPAWIVGEIFRRLAAGESARSIGIDLDARGVATKYGGAWRAGQINYIAQNPTYIARRFHQAGEWVPCPDGKDRLRGHMADRRNRIIAEAEVSWPPLTDDATFWAVQQIFLERSRAPKKPARARHLLSNIARCAKCGGYLTGHNARQRQRGPVYQCKDRSCVGIYERDLDAHVEHVLVGRDDIDPDFVGFLADPEVYADLTKVDDSAMALQARAEADAARAELAALYREVETGATTRRMAAADEKRLLAVVGDADRRAESATVPSVLAGVIGPQAKERWAGLDMAVKRQIIILVADIRVRPVGRGRGRTRDAGNGKFTASRTPVAERVVWRRRLGPDAGQDS